jgi:hypothetical protein
MNVEGILKDVNENQCAMGLSCSSMTGSADAINCVNRFNCTLAAVATSYSRLGSHLDVNTNDEQSQGMDAANCAHQMPRVDPMPSLEVLVAALNASTSQDYFERYMQSVRPTSVALRLITACALFSVGAVFGIMIHDGLLSSGVIENRDYSALYFFLALATISSFVAFVIAMTKLLLLRS